MPIKVKDWVSPWYLCFLKGPKLPFSAVGHAMVTIHNNVIVINGPEIMKLVCGNPPYFEENQSLGAKNYDMIGKIFEGRGNYCWWVQFGQMQHPR